MLRVNTSLILKLPLFESAGADERLLSLEGGFQNRTLARLSSTL
jgi:hypothetical protein